MFGHDHVTADVTPIPTAHPFEFTLERFSHSGTIEQRHPAITAKRDEVQAVLMLVTFGLRSHFEGILNLRRIPPFRKKREKSLP